MVGCEQADDRLQLRTWAHTDARGSLAGSLYAAEPRRRLAAARAMVHAGLQIHLDVITRPDGRADGVLADEVHALRVALPDAPIELHLIDLTEGLDRLVSSLATVIGIGPTRVHLPAAAWDRRPDTIHQVRSSGAELWQEIASAADVAPEIAQPSEIDGALMMLIPPGSHEPADLRRLELVTELRTRLPVGVDGGVDEHNFEACIRAGAVHLVSGRGLFVDMDAAQRPRTMNGDGDA